MLFLTLLLHAKSDINRLHLMKTISCNIQSSSGYQQLLTQDFGEGQEG